MTIDDTTGDPGLAEPAEPSEDDFIPGPLDEEDAEAFEDHTAEDNLEQDLDDEDPLAPLKPPFLDVQ